ncbi:MOP flippase family protein [Vibrio sp. 03-59-1]|uniref:MOP flippase family protein n=1 Tax=Vibrio sp. 03-59-1 TaxID=2607607 RepID=UPI001493AD80|nr:MOP flippase family protein [Vibrio sp. 03-59-1]NOH84543.1 MOP flippase family protein [Vibrio sp. 03-59-1]
MTIAKLVVKGVSWTALATVIRASLQIAQLVILVRFLQPAELGVLALVNIVVGLAQIFADAGLSNAIIYHKDLSGKRLKQLYLVNISFGAFIAVLVGTTAYPVASFFNTPDLTSLLLMLCPIFFIRSFSQQPNALLQKELNFQALSKAETLSAVVGFIILIAGLLLGYKLYAVVASQLVNACILVLLLRRAIDCPLPSSLSIGWKENKQPFIYGLYQSGEALINYLSSQFDQLLLGKLLGAEVLGVYSYVKALVFRPAMQLINPIVHRVTFPLMTKYKDTHGLADMYQRIIQFLSIVNVPLYLGLALYPGWALNLAFGESWVEHWEVLRWLSLYMLLISLVNPIGALLRATGLVKRAFWWNVLVTVVRPVVVLLSFHYGLVYLAKALFIQQMILWVAHVFILLKPACQLSFRRYCSAIMLPLVIFSIAYSVVWLATYIFGEWSEWTQVLLLASVYILLFLPFAKSIIRQIKQG